MKQSLNEPLDVQDAALILLMCYWQVKLSLGAAPAPTFPACTPSKYNLTNTFVKIYLLKLN
jgi:hypothetical protein